MTQNKITIFLADDDEDDRYFFQTALKQLNLNAELTTFINGEELINYFKTGANIPDLIFLDINMPKTDGIECLKFLKNNHTDPNLKIIMLSTASENSIVELTKQNGASAYIEKPSHLKELTKYLSYCLANFKTDFSKSSFLLNARLKDY